MAYSRQTTQSAHRRCRRDSDIVRVEVRVPAIDAGVLRELAAILRGKSDAAQAVRYQLRSAVAKPRVGAVADIFGSDLPDACFNGVFDQSRQDGTHRDIEL